MTVDHQRVKDVLINAELVVALSFLIELIVSFTAPQSRNQKRENAIMSAIEVSCRMTLRTVSPL